MMKCQVHELKMSRDSVTSQSEGLEEELSAVIGNLERIERESTEREKFYLERWDVFSIILDVTYKVSNYIQTLKTRSKNRT